MNQAQYHNEISAVAQGSVQIALPHCTNFGMREFYKELMMKYEKD